MLLQSISFISNDLENLSLARLGDLTGIFLFILTILGHAYAFLEMIVHSSFSV